MKALTLLVIASLIFNRCGEKNKPILDSVASRCSIVLYERFKTSKTSHLKIDIQDRASVMQLIDIIKHAEVYPAKFVNTENIRFLDNDSNLLSTITKNGEYINVEGISYRLNDKQLSEFNKFIERNQ